MTAPANPWTPAPWENDGGAAYFARKPRIYGGRRLIAEVGNADPTAHEEWAANAALIAAAPALYDALKALVEQVKDYERVNNLAPNPGRSECWQATADALAALSKARGETP